MLSLFTKPLRLFTKALLANESDTQLALGFTIGAVIGLVPKDNLIAIALMVVLCSVKVNKPLGLLGAFAFSWFGPLTDSLSHKLGEWLLHRPILQSTYVAIYDAPLGPFWGFNNTVVVGYLVLGLYNSKTVYFMSRVLIGLLRPRVIERIRRYRMKQVSMALNVGAKWGTRS
jgi:uncharacterized protein (TIGR03546 family)